LGFFFGTDMSATDGAERVRLPFKNANLANAATTIDTSHRYALAAQAQHALEQAFVMGTRKCFVCLRDVNRDLGAGV
jgi:hypothetical protein